MDTSKPQNLKGFKRFERQRKQFKEPTLMMDKNKSFRLNASACRKFDLFKYDGVILYFNEDIRAIGLSFTNNKDEDGYNKLYKYSLSNVLFHARSFIKHFNIVDFVPEPIVQARENFYVIKLSPKLQHPPNGKE